LFELRVRLQAQRATSGRADVIGIVWRQCDSAFSMDSVVELRNRLFDQSHRP